MNRPPAKPALALVMASVLALSVPPAQAEETIINEVDILKSSTLTGTRIETRFVDTGNVKWYIDQLHLLQAVPFTEETITGPTSKVIKDWETRTYKTELRQYNVQAEQKREVKSYSDEYTRRTTKSVVDQTWSKWVFGGANTSGVDIRALPYAYGDPGSLRSKQWGYSYFTPPGPTEYDPSKWNEANVIQVTVSPSGWDSDHLQAILWFDKDLQYLGGWFNDGHGSTRISTANITRNADHDVISYHMNCTLNDDPWRWQPACGTNETRTYTLLGKLVYEKTYTTKKDVTTEATHFADRETYAPWTATGNTQKGSLSRAQPQFGSKTENVLISQRNAVHGGNAAKGLAAASNVKHRRIFSADSSSAQSRASLSGTQVRRALGADQAKASRLASSSRGSGAPELPLDLPGLRRGNGGSHPVAPTPTPAPAANATPSAPVASKPSPPPPLNGKEPTTPPALNVKAPFTPPPLNVQDPIAPDTWEFPRNPNKRPTRGRGGNYIGGRRG